MPSDSNIQERRRQLLAKEKELTRLSDELARERRELPWVPVGKEYLFDTDEGTKTLAQLFDGRSQLLAYHLMMEADWEEPCVGCSYSADHLDGSVSHLNRHDVTLIGVSRAPLARMEDYRGRMGWEFPWVSCIGNDFTFDFGPSTPERELHAFSAFALQDGTVFHTYSTNDRGTDVMNPTWQLLDRAPYGRNGFEPARRAS